MPSKPELIIEIPTSRPGLRGYLDRRRPHAINHLIVGNLGDEEMLLAACDDGDVVIYNLRSIDYALDQGVTIATARRFGMCRDGEGRHRTNLVLPLGDDAHVPNTHVVEPWFLTNVGASAWGLAVHESARMFAVSSNTKLIKVFAPALGNMHCPEAFVQCGPPILNDEGRYTMRTRTSQQRMFDLEINLEGHQANIPNIAFCNTGFDPEGIYLVSTDIEGSTFVWDIWCGDTVLEMHDRGESGTPFAQHRALIDPDYQASEDGV